MCVCVCVCVCVCRSPLNVVHVGLEQLVSIIKSTDPAAPYISIDRSNADFILQMFYSSESAINILNDMLQYEHIEAGRNNNAYIHTYIHTYANFVVVVWK